MVPVSLVALALTLSGLLILVRSTLGRRGVPSLEKRGVDAHLWGYHLLSAGLVLTLGSWIFLGRSWHDLSGIGQGAVVGAAFWIVAALGLCVSALRRPAESSGPRVPRITAAGIPAPGTRPGLWSPAYRAFLAAGFVLVAALALLAG